MQCLTWVETVPLEDMCLLRNWFCIALTAYSDTYMYGSSNASVTKNGTISTSTTVM